jgi:hypothetical protein
VGRVWGICGFFGGAKRSARKTSLLRRVIFKACDLSRLLPPWPSHNIRNPSPCLFGWVLPQTLVAHPRPALPPGHHFAAARSSSDYGVLCEVMVGAPNFVVCLLRRSVLEAHPLPALQESRQPARSSAPPSGPRHRDRVFKMPDDLPFKGTVLLLRKSLLLGCWNA